MKPPPRKGDLVVLVGEHLGGGQSPGDFAEVIKVHAGTDTVVVRFLEGGKRMWLRPKHVEPLSELQRLAIAVALPAAPQEE